MFESALGVHIARLLGLPLRLFGSLAILFGCYRRAIHGYCNNLPGRVVPPSIRPTNRERVEWQTNAARTSARAPQVSGLYCCMYFTARNGEAPRIVLALARSFDDLARKDEIRPYHKSRTDEHQAARKDPSPLSSLAGASRWNARSGR
jgi:hypothetical protein